MLLFAALVSAGLWGGPFWRALLRQSQRVWRRKQRELTETLGSEGAAIEVPSEAPVPVESLAKVATPPVLGAEKR